MQGEISFADSLSERIKLLSLDRKHINTLNSISYRYISKSFIAHKDFIMTHKEDIYIISWWFTECILPIAAVFGIDTNRIFANEFVYQGDTVIWVNTSLATAQNRGKSLVAKKLNLWESSLVVWDGFTDYEIKRDWHAGYFWAYIENVDRPWIRDHADIVLTGVQNIQLFVQKKTSIEA
jgi:D-3-phosphoglycerate dehydrogenase